jgi:hypothetical protein
MSHRVKLLRVSCLFVSLTVSTAVAQSRPAVAPKYHDSELVSFDRGSISVRVNDEVKQFTLAPGAEFIVRSFAQLTDVPVGTLMMVKLTVVSGLPDAQDWTLFARPGQPPDGRIHVYGANGQTVYHVNAILKSHDPLVVQSLPINAPAVAGKTIELKKVLQSRDNYYDARTADGEISVELGANVNLIGKGALVHVERRFQNASRVSFFRTEPFTFPKPRK